MMPYPSWICGSCGELHRRRPAGTTSTWHEDVCGVCGKRAWCTEPRDFGHLKDSWKQEVKS